MTTSTTKNQDSQQIQIQMGGNFKNKVDVAAAATTKASNEYKIRFD
jgi:hypothetical protein